MTVSSSFYVERQFRSSREINNLTTEIIQEDSVKQDEFQLIMSILNNSTLKDVNPNESLLIQFNYDSGLTRQFLYTDLIQDYPDFPKLLCNCNMKKEGKVKRNDEIDSNFRVTRRNQREKP
jgi:hypothetical protein